MNGRTNYHQHHNRKNMAALTLYHAAKVHSENLTLKHFGSLDSSIYRAVSIFTGDMGYSFGPNGECIYMPFEDSAPQYLSHEQFIERFCEAMQQYTIKEYHLHTNKSLKLNDEWMDDPIGSGGMAIFQKNSLSEKEQQELWAIFKPFNTPIHPGDIERKYSKKEIKQLLNKLKLNKIGKKELASRKCRARFFNEDFNHTKYQETVWIDYTLKLRNWAIQNQYDSLCYKNTEEGKGELSYVVLNNNTIKHSNRTVTFDKEKYIKLIAPIFNENTLKYLKSHAGKRIEAESIMWANHNPSDFWKSGD